MGLGAIGTQLRIIPVWQQVQSEYCCVYKVWLTLRLEFHDRPFMLFHVIVIKLLVHSCKSLPKVEENNGQWWHGLVCRDRDRMTRGLSHSNPLIGVLAVLITVVVGRSNMCSFSLSD
ncbi:hypothetical protein BO85DRAFT_27922 [Aspergillus piperis CBS 112811]|uniref:Uncharacterized protein n=1 Tax=Aspergillus piperis CBS 112811 TaxID=1448313 RepID=A0A8G1RBJ9_9EURO|nr:hypothetical protein BO85DRAFT_27922 [Aspergillus piperis CBS 112811]RAH63656.1 hypothetical protein BO85DRAFT_27922 [Aspergillus piperis CBS 112811]